MNNQQASLGSKHILTRFFTPVFVTLAMFSLMLVPWISFYYRPYFAYYNGSDEQLYLTYQGGLALTDYRGRWLSSHLVLWAHEIGLSGAALNLMMDISVPLFMLAMVAYALKRLGVLGNVWIGAWFVVFGSSLFNQSNPLLQGLLPDFRYDETFWVSAFEGFAPYIRTPEPQLSLMLVLIAWIAFLRIGWLVLLLLPVPFLYDNVLMPYGYLLAFYLARRWLLKTYSIKTEMILNVATVAVLALGIALVDSLGLFNAYAELPFHYRHTHSPVLSLSLLIAALVVIIMWYRSSYQRVSWSTRDSSALAVCFMQLFLSNHTVISGVSIFPQALQSVGGTFGSAFLMLYLVQLLPWPKGKRAIEFFLGVWVLWSINNSQGLQLANNRYRFEIYHDISAQDLERFRSNPLGYVGGTQLFKGYIALAYPKQLMPPMAHLYNFSFLMGACEPLARLHESALRFVHENLNDPLLAHHRAGLDAEAAAINKALNNVNAYRDRCPEGVPASVDFTIYPNNNDTMVLLQLIPPRVTRQGIDF